MEVVELSHFQIQVAHIFFRLKAAEGYVVAGGAGLLASKLISRPTEDLDLFAYAPIKSVTAARDAFAQALGRRGWQITFLVDSPAFCRMHIVDGDNEVLVDLAIDSPPSATPAVTILGPTLAPLELAGRKLLALFGRAEARDFADVYRLARRFGKDVLVERAAALDAGFDSGVLAQMMLSLGRFTDDEIPITLEAIKELRSFFGEWAGALVASAEETA